MGSALCLSDVRSTHGPRRGRNAAFMRQRCEAAIGSRIGPRGVRFSCFCRLKAAFLARFMGSDLCLADVPSAHEPKNRKSLEIKEAIFRFMGSGLCLADVPSAHEPQNRKWLEINGTILRFMGSCGTRLSGFLGGGSRCPNLVRLILIL